jgi:hypothetical protein
MEINMHEMPPSKSIIYAPVGGWVEQSYYIVELSVGRCNPIWRALMYTGFLDAYDAPGGYSGFISHAEGHGDIDYYRVHYMKPLHHITKEVDFEIVPTVITAWEMKVEIANRPDRKARAKHEAEYWAKHYEGIDE